MMAKLHRLHESASAIGVYFVIGVALTCGIALTLAFAVLPTIESPFFGGLVALTAFLVLGVGGIGSAYLLPYGGTKEEA